MGSVILLSGGLDSVVAAYASRREHAPELALTFDYGQRAAAMELRAAQSVAAKLGVEHRLVELPWLAEISGASITDAASDPALDTDASVWVPARNAVFLSIAAAFAESMDCDAIVCGFNAEEAAEFADNSAEFVRRFNDALELGARNAPKIVSPTLALTKVEIVRLGAELGAPLHLVWSCYGAGPEQCGQCPSCRRLCAALRLAGQWESFVELSTSMRGQETREGID